MSITSSLNNALSGLTAASRSAQLVSNNVANALTEGYGRREISLSGRVLDGGGSGVKIDAVTRAVDQGVLRDRRFADATLGYADGKTAFLEALSSLVGTPDEDQSISGRFRALESSLITAASRPDSDTRLNAVAASARELAGALNAASDGIQAKRLDADRSIALQVARLNTGLEQVQEFNAAISRLNGLGRDVTGLEDQRQRAIDAIAEIVPIREVPRDDGKISLYTDGGAILLDDSAVTVDFTPVNFVTADMTVNSGALSQLSIRGVTAATSGSFAPLGGGTLAAAFEVRDSLAPNAQSELDALARDLIERFEDPAVDGTTAVGAPGLFTDGSGALVAANEIGLAGRISLNASTDPDQGGALRLLRDGLGATVPGPVGNAAQLTAFADALNQLRPPVSGSQTGFNHSVHSLSASLSSRITGDLVVAERSSGFAAAEQQSLRDIEYASGVDTDQEMQKLLLIEQSYAANAKVVQTIDSLIGELLSI